MNLPFPKELYPVKGKPVVSFLFEAMIRAEVRKFLVVIGENKQQIMHYLGNGERFGVSVGYTYQENPLGLANAVTQIKPFVSNEVLVLGLPDTIIEGQFSFKTVINACQARKSDVVLGLFKVKHPEKFGVVEVADGSRKILSIKDKPRSPVSKWVWGVAVFGESIFKVIDRIKPSQNELQLTDAFQMALDLGLDVSYVKFPRAVYTDIGGGEMD